MNNPRADQNANERGMAGVISMGKVVEVDLSNYTARVQDGDLISGWLRMGMQRAMGAQQTWPYVVGEEVGFATINGEMEDGFIICSLANGQQPANAAANDLKIHSIGNIEIIADGNVTINGARIDLN